MPYSDFNRSMQQLRNEINEAMQRRDDRCAERGATLARHQEHMDGVNGSLDRIDKRLTDLDAKLDALCEAFAGWKGQSAPLLSIASAFIGAVAATIITFLKAHLGGTQ